MAVSDRLLVLPAPTTPPLAPMKPLEDPSASSLVEDIVDIIDLSEPEPETEAAGGGPISGGGKKLTEEEEWVLVAVRTQALPQPDFQDVSDRLCVF